MTYPLQYGQLLASITLSSVKYTQVTERDFHAAMHREPESRVHPLAYADYLEERGMSAMAEMIRRHIDLMEPEDTASLVFPHDPSGPQAQPWVVATYPARAAGTDQLISLANQEGYAHGLALERLSEHDPSRRFLWPVPLPKHEVLPLYDRLRAEGAGHAR